MSRHRLAFYALGAALALVVFVAAVVLTARPAILTGLLGGGQCRAAAAVGARVTPLATGAMAAFRAVPPTDLAALPFDGTRTLGELRGRTILLNLWATWCPPCRAEMPFLAALDERLGSDEFQVVAVSIDDKDANRPEDFLAETGAASLAYHREPTLALFRSLRQAGLVEGMPTTLLIAEDGCAAGVLAGAAGWSSPEAVALIEAALAAP